METMEEKFKALSIARRIQPEEPTYLLDLSLQTTSGSGPGLVAVCCSNRSIRLHTRDSLTLLREYRGYHTGPLCGARFAHCSPDLLFSASADGTVRSWDVRCPGSEANTQVFRSDPSHCFCSFDVSCTDLLLCAGTEQVGEEEDSYLVFWDARMPKENSEKSAGGGGGVLGVYSESHSDDITAVHFHPVDKDRLASGSTDGLVNVFDLSLGAEEDALLATCNSGSSASSVCWAGGDRGDQLLCLSHDEGLHLWDLGQLDTDEPLTLLSIPDARTLTPLTDGGSLDYLVGGAWLEESATLLVVGGNSNGDVHLLECGGGGGEGGGLRLLSSLRGGHSAVVRCFVWEPEGGALLTGGEDAQMLLWKAGAEELTAGKRDTLKSASALKLKSRPHKKHSAR